MTLSQSYTDNRISSSRSCIGHLLTIFYVTLNFVDETYTLTKCKTVDLVKTQQETDLKFWGHILKYLILYLQRDGCNGLFSKDFATS